MTSSESGGLSVSRRKTLTAVGAGIAGVTLGFGGLASADPFAGGDGSESDPYEISSWVHLDNVRSHSSSNFVLTADLDAGSSGYDTLASGDANDEAGWDPLNFDGSFDGGGHVVSDFVVDRPDGNRVGLFGDARDSTIENLGVDVTFADDQDFRVVGDSQVGALAGIADTVSNCFAFGRVGEDPIHRNEMPFEDIGGLVGDLRGEMTDSWVRVLLYGVHQVGGLAGTSSGTIARSYARGIPITGTGGDATMMFADGASHGGLVGENTGVIEESYAVGELMTDDFSTPPTTAVGGIAGKHSGDEARISDCYARGFVNISLDEGYVGGLVGENVQEATLERSYFEGDVNGFSGYEGKVAGLNDATIEDVYYEDLFDDDAIGEDTGTATVTSLDPGEMRGDDAVANMDALDFDDTWATVIDNRNVSAGNKTNFPILQVNQLDPIGPFEDPPQDLTNDGFCEDVNGNGLATVVDVQALHQHRTDAVVANNPERFSFSRSDPTAVTDSDLESLYNRVSDGGL